MLRIVATWTMILPSGICFRAMISTLTKWWISEERRPKANILKIHASFAIDVLWAKNMEPFTQARESGF